MKAKQKVKKLSALTVIIVEQHDKKPRPHATVDGVMTFCCEARALQYCIDQRLDETSYPTKATITW